MGKTFSTGLLTDGISQDSSNNIGIGVAPSGTNKFEVSGSTKLNGNALMSGSLTISSSANAIILPAGQTIGLGSAQIYTGTGGNSGNIFIQGAQTKLYADKVVLEAATAAGVEVIGGTKLSGSFIVSGSATTIGATTLSGSLTVSGSATTIGTTVLSGSLTVSGSITSTSTITAQTLVVQTITSSIVYSSGSNIFGNSLSNTQVMTGSVGITGSLAVAGTGTFSGLITSTVGNGGTLLKSINATTGLQVGVDLRNTGGVAQIGIESSVGGTFVNGSTAYASIFGSGNATAAEIQTNGTVRLSISSTGAANFTNSLRIQGSTVPTSGSGTELSWDGTNGYLLAFNRSTSAYLPLSILGSSLSFTGAATFASSVSVGGHLTGNGVNPGGLGASRYIIDWSGGYSRVFSMGVNASTNGGIILNSQRSDGTNSIDALTIAPSGAATFSSQVAIGTTIVGNYPLLLKAASGDTLIYGVSSNGTYAFDCYIDGSSGQLVFRNGSCVAYLPRTAGTWVGNSDRTVKENIELIPDALNKIMQLNGYTYNLIDDKENSLVGVIAQEVQQVLPQAVHKNFSRNYDKEILGVEYDVLIPLLINAIKELSAKNDALQTRITQLENN